MNQAFKELMAMAEELSSRQLLREARVRDKGAIAALKEHLETMPTPPEGVGLFGVTIYEDVEVPPGVIRFYFTDDTTKDLWIT